MSGRKIAVVLFNLGGPDRPESVRPFLKNLFSDPAIIGLPAPFRQMLAWLISTLRDKSARANYAYMGGGSPLLPETEKQADALLAVLKNRLPGDEVRTFIAMRYWHPFVDAAAKDVAAYAPDEVVLLPLYPQYSTTTTRSSVQRWKKVYRGSGKTREICCYPAEPKFIDAHARLIATELKSVKGPARILFSAHGLPKKVIDAGDPYQKQVEATAAAIMAKAGEKAEHQVCYQSRVGPMEWIGPSTVEAIEKACDDGVAIILCPVAFVSEHIETLVELDIEYRHLADELGCKAYHRIPALGATPEFIDGLADLTTGALEKETVAPGPGWTSEACGPICPCREAA